MYIVYKNTKNIQYKKFKTYRVPVIIQKTTFKYILLEIQRKRDKLINAPSVQYS